MNCGTRNQELGTKHPGHKTSGTRTPKFKQGTRNQEIETRNQKLGTKNPGNKTPGTRTPKFEQRIRNQELGTRDRELGTRNPETRKASGPELINF